MEKLIVIADLGRIRAVRTRGDSRLTHDETHLVEESGEIPDSKPKPVSEVVTDQQGRFSSGTGASGRGPGMATGERHGLESEIERKQLRALAVRIDSLVSEASEDCKGWILAAPQTYLRRLKELLSETSRNSLLEAVAGDLTRLPLKDLEARFFKAP